MAANPTHGTFEELMKKFPPEQVEICGYFRQLATELHPEFVEICWIQQGIASYGVGPKKMTEHYIYLMPHKAHINLGFYHGAGLPDPQSLMEGTGQKLRHIKIRSLADAQKDEVKALIIAAIEDRKSA